MSFGRVVRYAARHIFFIAHDLCRRQSNFSFVLRSRTSRFQVVRPHVRGTAACPSGSRRCAREAPNVSSVSSHILSTLLLRFSFHKSDPSSSCRCSFVAWRWRPPSSVVLSHLFLVVSGAASDPLDPGSWFGSFPCLPRTRSDAPLRRTCGQKARSRLHRHRHLRRRKRRRSWPKRTPESIPQPRTPTRKAR